MAEDREILREIWDGRVPVCFSLAPEEVYTVEKPEPFYLLVPRQSYFPLVTDKVQRHFSKHIDGEQQTDSEFWLECDGQPIKWHYPVGLLFDLYGNEDSLPWSLSVHFQDFPAEDVLHCSSKEAVEAHFMSTVKEADSLKHRGQVINSMQKRDHKQLWMGLHNDKFEQFWSINRKLMESSGEEMFKFIPYRLYQQDKLVIQKLFRPNADNGDPHTLEDLLKSAFPELFENEELSRRSRVLVQGVEAPLNTPVLWMSYHLSYPDNFLHIAVIQRSSGEDMDLSGVEPFSPLEIHPTSTSTPVSTSTPTNPHVCGSCGKTFSRKDNKDRHTASFHGKTSVKCKRCPKQFSTKRVAELQHSTRTLCSV